MEVELEEFGQNADSKDGIANVIFCHVCARLVGYG